MTFLVESMLSFLDNQSVRAEHQPPSTKGAIFRNIAKYIRDTRDYTEWLKNQYNEASSQRDSALADVEELVGSLPDCGVVCGCQNASTRERVLYGDETIYACDLHSDPPRWSDTEWGPIVRRLNANQKRKP